MDADADLKRLVDAADALERQAAELREQIADLADALRNQPVPEQPASDDGPAADESDARLVAYSMVLDGKPRDEVAAQLREEFGLEDSDALLDDVYARAG
jgi:hypothetical protein